MLDPTRPIRASYLSEGAYRLVYSLRYHDSDTPDTGEDTGYVLKVDNLRSAARVEDRLMYRPHSERGCATGCDTEASLYLRISEEVPSLSHYFLPVLQSGPGWLIQEKAASVGLPSAADRNDLEAALLQTGDALGLYFWDTINNNANIGLSRHGHPVIFDYAAVRPLHPQDLRTVSL